MIKRILAQTDLGDLLTFVSPSLFDVISVPAVLRRLRGVRAASKQGWTEQARGLSQRIPAGVRHSDEPGDPFSGIPHERRAEVGQRILALYFAQLFSDAPTIVDLRRDRWSWSDGELLWSPARLMVSWEPGFQSAIQRVYRGFYEGDDALFDEALGQLGLSGAGHLLRAHFGDGDATVVTFERQHFVDSFGAIFEHCKRSGVRLDPDFVLLGAYLGGLYDALSDLGQPMNVAEAFRASTQPGARVA